MGKDLHYSILKFVKAAFESHQAIKSFDIVSDPDFHIFHIKRKFNYTDLYVVLSDDYYFGDYDMITRHSILKKGGFILVDKPEANNYNENDAYNKISIGKIGKLLGALNKNDFWNYEPPSKKKF
jgi:hypothetical protein